MNFHQKEKKSVLLIWIQNKGGTEKDIGLPIYFWEIKRLHKLFKKIILFTGYISKFSPSKGGREIETYGTFSLPAIITMNIPKKKTYFYSKPPPMTLHLDSAERNNSAEATEIGTVFFQSHYKKYQLQIFSYLLYFT